MTIRLAEMEVLETVPVYSNKGIHMAELGNQKLVYQDYYGPAKKYFEGRGINHFSFDLNKKDGAIPIDLSKPVDKKWVGLFDIITNSGTTEHITNSQVEVFTNIHNICKVGGYILHSVPMNGCWKGHSPHKYTKGFIEALCEANGYEVLFNGTTHRWKGEYNILGLCRKVKDQEFVVSESWLNEITTTDKYKRNKDNLK